MRVIEKVVRFFARRQRENISVYVEYTPGKFRIDWSIVPNVLLQKKYLGEHTKNK